MTRNITMAIDEDLLKKARKVAIDKNTTLTGLIRNYLMSITEKEENRKKQIVLELESLFSVSRAKMGKKTWTRGELHER